MSHIEDITELMPITPVLSDSEATNEFINLYQTALFSPINGGGDAKETLDRLIFEVPDKPEIFTRDTVDFTLRIGPSDFELYFLSLLRDFDFFVDSNKFYPGFRVIDSIKCLRDTIRTKKFLKGNFESVLTLSEHKEEIYMCDAGSGAIPVLAIYAALTSPKVRAVCLELNPNSVGLAREVVLRLGLENRITVLECDATQYVPDRSIDFLVSETMGNALTNEPIVSIMNNLARYVRPGGIILPDKVLVKATAISVDDYASDRGGYVRVGGILERYNKFDWQTVAEFYPGVDLEKISFSLNNPANASTDYVVLLTSVVNIGSQCLEIYDSLISKPKTVKGFDGKTKAFKLGSNKIHVEYIPGQIEKKIISY